MMRCSTRLIGCLVGLVLLVGMIACNDLTIFGMRPFSSPTITPQKASTEVALTLTPFSTQAAASCPVTEPTGAMSSDKALEGLNLSNPENTLLTNLWPDSTIIFRPGGAGEIAADGSLSMKWPWYRHNIKGQVTVEGRRLDAFAPPLRSIVGCCYGDNTAAPDCCYGDTGFTPSTLIFPSAGCWEVTGRVQNHQITFVVLVLKLDR